MFLFFFLITIWISIRFFICFLIRFLIRLFNNFFFRFNYFFFFLFSLYILKILLIKKYWIIIFPRCTDSGTRPWVPKVPQSKVSTTWIPNCWSEKIKAGGGMLSWSITMDARPCSNMVLPAKRLPYLSR